MGSMSIALSGRSRCLYLPSLWHVFPGLDSLGHSAVCKQDRERTTSPGKEVHDPWAFYLLPLFIDRLMGRGWLAGKTLDLRIVGRRWY